MVAVGGEVDEVVQNIDARSAKGKGDRGQRGVKQRPEIEFMRRQQRQEHQRILRVLMHADQLQPLPQIGFRRIENFDAERREPSVQFGRRPDADPSRRRRPHRQVGFFIADIVEAASPKASVSRLALASADRLELASEANQPSNRPS